MCGERKGKVAMAAHLRTCVPARLGGGNAGTDALLVLRVQARYDPIYWLDILVKPEAGLAAVDKLLRRVWLECCGHLSEFYDSSSRTVGMNQRVGEVFDSTSDRLGYEYDFGSSTELVLRLAGAISGRLGRSVHLGARNEPPIWPCALCGRPATEICTECMYEGKGFCCREHAPDHACDEEMLLPVVNSPRMGVCGYMGEI